MDINTLFYLRQGIQKSDPQTRTEKDQCRTEALVRKAYNEKLDKWGESSLRLFKMEHISYLVKRLVDLPTTLEHLDASQPWLAYWMVHALRLLNFQIAYKQKNDLINLIKSCQHSGGGFAGGPHQLAHLAPTYASVNCLASLLSTEALDVIDRSKLVDWLRSLKQSDGSFIMHHGGEVDVRSAYCAVSVAALTGILDSEAQLFENTANWIMCCQTYEGGFGGQPGLESHGGYSFCAFSALHILGQTHLIDIPRLLRWASHRQLPTEGGFQGRTYKLVDSCYSFWVGALFPLIEDVLSKSGDPSLPEGSSLFDTLALQEYIILCCQRVFYMRPGLSVPSHLLDANGGAINGGLIDKPGKNVDPYHTCYSLSGLSVAQHTPRLSPCSTTQSPVYPEFLINSRQKLPQFPSSSAKNVAGVQWGNELMDVDPSFNITIDAVAFTRVYFSALDSGFSIEEACSQANAILESFRHTQLQEEFNTAVDVKNDFMFEKDCDLFQDPSVICTSP